MCRFLKRDCGKCCLIAVLLIMLLLLLSGCSSSAKSEKEIIADLQQSPVFISESIKIEDYEIIKRQTDVNNKTDQVYMTVYADTPDLTYSLTYVLEYELYNEGWILESVMRYHDGPWEFSGLSDEQLLADIKGNDYYFSDWELNVENVEIIEESCDSNAMVYYEKRVSADLTAHETLFDYYATYNMYYGVVDGVWALQSAEIRSRRYAPTFSPNMAATDKVIGELTLGDGASATQYDSFEYLRTDADWENCTEVRYYTATKDWWFGTETYLIAIPLGFSLENGEDHAMWTYRNDTIESMLQSVDWNIGEVWCAADSHAQASLSIYHISATEDPDTFSVLLRCVAYDRNIFGDIYYCSARNVQAAMWQTAPGIYHLFVDKDLLSVDSVGNVSEDIDGIWQGDFWIKGMDSNTYGSQGINWMRSDGVKLEIAPAAEENERLTIASVSLVAKDHGLAVDNFDKSNPIYGIWKAVHFHGISEIFAFCPDGTIVYDFIQTDQYTSTAAYTYDGTYLSVNGGKQLLGDDSVWLLNWEDDNFFSMTLSSNQETYWISVSRVLT